MRWAISTAATAIPFAWKAYNSTAATAIIGTSPRRLQLYPSLGKHFQTSPVPVHFDGNKMMKMQTTYSSHVLFCTKSSGGLSKQQDLFGKHFQTTPVHFNGNKMMKMQTTYSSQVLFCTKSSGAHGHGGLSKQQDYSNTNTAVSLLPPTQETPKMILRWILVSIVSSAALLLYSSQFISHCFAKTKPCVPRNIDNCSVCEAVAKQLFDKVKDMKKSGFPSKKPKYDPVEHVTRIVEKVCKNDDWIGHINPIEENNESQVCDSRCPEKICMEVMKKVIKVDFANFICGQRWDGELKSLKTHLCENLTKACSTKKELVDVGEAVGISPELIDLLPTSKYKEKGLAKFIRPVLHAFDRFGRIISRKKSERCAVCQMEYKRGVLQITLPCKHVYHSGCIKDWLSNNKVCPLCRKEVVVNESN